MPAKSNALENFGTGLGQAAVGGGIGLIGDMMAPKVEVPNLAGLGADLQTQLKEGQLGDPVAKAAGMKELLGVLGQNMGEVPTNAFTLGDTKGEEAKQKALANYVSQWKGIRPGADFSNDPEFVRGYNEIQKQYDDERVMQRDQQQYQYLQQQMEQKKQYMMQALNVDQAQIEQYVQLAQLNVDQLMLEYGLSVGEAQQFKDLFSDMGQLAAEGMGNNQGTNINDVLMSYAN